MRLRPIVLAIAATALAAAVAGCCVRGSGYYRVSTTASYDEPHAVIVNRPPPQPPAPTPEQARPPKPSENAVWVPGHWIVERGDWRWRPGQWERPRPGFAWEPPTVAESDDGVRYHPPYWRPEDETPPPAYHKPSEHPVHVGEPPRHRAEVTPRDDAPGGEDPRTDTPAHTARPPATPAERVETRPDSPAQTARPPAERVEERPTTEARPPATRAERVDPSTEPDPPEEGSDTERPAAEARPPGTRAERVDPPAEARRPGQRVGVEEREPLACELKTPRAPAGGLITIEVRGAGESPTIRLGGEIIPIEDSQRRDDRLQARIPRGTTTGGKVTIEADGEKDACGPLEIIGG